MLGKVVTDCDPAEDDAEVYSQTADEWAEQMCRLDEIRTAVALIDQYLVIYVWWTCVTASKTDKSALLYVKQYVSVSLIILQFNSLCLSPPGLYLDPACSFIFKLLSLIMQQL